MPDEDYEYGTDAFNFILEANFNRDSNIQDIMRKLYQFSQKYFINIKPSDINDLKENKYSQIDFSNDDINNTNRLLKITGWSLLITSPHISGVQGKTKTKMFQVVLDFMVYEDKIFNEFHIKMSQFFREWRNFLISLKPLRCVGVGEAGSRDIEWDGLDFPVYFNSMATLITFISDYYNCKILDMDRGMGFLKINIRDIFSQLPYPSKIGLRLYPDGSLMFGRISNNSQIPDRLGIDLDNILIKIEDIKYKIDIKELSKSINDAKSEFNSNVPIPIIYSVLIKEGILGKKGHSE